MFSSVSFLRSFFFGMVVAFVCAVWVSEVFGSPLSEEFQKYDDHVFSPCSQVSLRRSRRRRKRYRWKRKKMPMIAILIQKISPSGRIDRDKLRLSIQHKLKRIAYCYQLMVLEERKKKAKKKRSKKTKKKKLLGELTMNFQLNAFGRALSVQVKKSNLTRSRQDCFLWYFRGRKFFPPQGNKGMKFRLVLRVVRGQKKKKKRKKRR